MRVFSSLQSRIFIASAMLAVLSIGTAIYLVSRRVTRQVESSLHNEIAAAGTLVGQFRRARTQNLELTARLVADAPRLKAAVDTNDPATVQDTANDYRGQLDSAVLIITGKTGRTLATIGTPARTAGGLLEPSVITRAVEGREGSALIPQPDGILQLVTVPMTIGLERPDLLGTLSVGFLLDDRFAAQLKEVTGSDIAFAVDGRVVSATLSAADRDALASVLRTEHPVADVALHGEEFSVLPMALTSSTGGPGDPGTGPMALVLRSRTEQLRFLDEIHTELALTALVAVGLATLLSFAVARTITRPLAAITGVMRDVAATGDLTRKIVLRSNTQWDDEDAQLLAATFNTLTDSVARAQREVAQRERLSSLGRLSTVIAHEVRNPLMIIKAALHSLRRPAATPDDIRESVGDIDGEVVRLNRVVNDVLDFARPIAFELAPTDLNRLCREAAAAAQAEPGAPVSIHTDPALGTIVTDAERLRAALVNIIVNARHAVEGQETRQVTLSTRRDGQTAVISVTDTGAGIERVDLPRVFDPFFTTKRGGTGLGLPITRNIVEGLGGSIVAESEPGRGTEIRVTVPTDLTLIPESDTRAKASVS